MDEDRVVDVVAQHDADRAAQEEGGVDRKKQRQAGASDIVAHPGDEDPERHGEEAEDGEDAEDAGADHRVEKEIVIVAEAEAL